MIDQLAAENLGAVKIGKVNVDENPNVAQSYGVSSIPTLILFKMGAETTLCGYATQISVAIGTRMN